MSITSYKKNTCHCYWTQCNKQNAHRLLYARIYRNGSRAPIRWRQIRLLLSRMRGTIRRGQRRLRQGQQDWIWNAVSQIMQILIILAFLPCLWFSKSWLSKTSRLTPAHSLITMIPCLHWEIFSLFFAFNINRSYGSVCLSLSLSRLSLRFYFSLCPFSSLYVFMFSL